jgi:hypothetical protein
MGGIEKQGKERFTHVWRVLGGMELGMGEEVGRVNKV